MTDNLEYKNIVVKKNHVNDEAVYTRTDYFNNLDFNNLDFNDLYLIEQTSKLSKNEELTWFILMMSICFSFIIGIIKYMPLCKS